MICKIFGNISSAPARREGGMVRSGSFFMRATRHLPAALPVLAGCFLVSLFLPAGEVCGKAYYRWTDNEGIIHLSDQPCRGGPCEPLVLPDEPPGGGAAESVAGGTKGGGRDREVTEEKKNRRLRQESVVRNLDALARHYEDVGGIRAGKMAALKEAAVVVKKARMDGSEADELFYLKIEDLLRSIKDHTAIIGRVHRLLKEARVMKGLAPPPQTENTDEDMS